MRSAVAKVASPLRRPGISKLVAKRNCEEVASLERGEIPEVLEIQSETTQYLVGEIASDGRPQQLVVKILKPSFADGKWSVSDGSKKFEVSMGDERFIERVHAREIGFSMVISIK